VDVGVKVGVKVGVAVGEFGPFDDVAFWHGGTS